jgi:serine phosphatase RsbU (regulator of sigma subunit)
VGRRLLLSYLLIGLVPVPIALSIGFVGAYLLSGFFLTHLVRVSLAEAGIEARATAADAVAARAARQEWSPPFPGMAVAFYRDGERVGGDERAPANWPTWLEQETALQAQVRSLATPPVVATLPDGGHTVAAAVTSGTAGAVAFLDGDLETILRDRSRIWVELLSGSQEEPGGATVSVGDNRWVLQQIRRTPIARDIESYFAERGMQAGFLVRGLDSYGPGYDLATGAASSSRLSATLFAPPGVVQDLLLSSAAEVDTLAWLAFIVPAFLLLDVYAAAAVVAAVMIVGLSRAVNSLSTATAKVQEGDFAVRIPVRRRDQLGALQHSFNDMTANLQTLVVQAASQELLHKELQIAQDLQRSLLPDASLIASESVEIATFFEPSAAIGGDYFDLFHVGPERRRLVVVVADVAGHGIAAGLRMAMLKAALDTLVREGKPPEEILGSLDGLVRAGRADTRFVTATLADIDLVTGTVDITNAGHPPTYRLCGDGRVDEILLPSSPLGALGRRYGRQVVQVEPGEVLIWVSDGFIEACDDTDESFGYDRVVTALGGDCASALAVRDRLIEAVRDHTGLRPLSDDRTLVALRYLGPPAAAFARANTSFVAAAS